MIKQWRPPKFKAMYQLNHDCCCSGCHSFWPKGGRRQWLLKPPPRTANFSVGTSVGLGEGSLDRQVAKELAPLVPTSYCQLAKALAPLAPTLDRQLAKELAPLAPSLDCQLTKELVPLATTGDHQLAKEWAPSAPMLDCQLAKESAYLWG